MPWHSVEEKKTLTIGVILECPTWPVQPTILRALKTATDKLKQAGHNIIMLEKFPSFTEATDLSWKFFDIDVSSSLGCRNFPIASEDPSGS